MAAVKNIILDLGGVLLNIDYKKTEKAFADLGFLQFNQMYTQYNADKVFSRLETGHISNSEFYEYMISLVPAPISSKQVRDAWCAMLLDFREKTIDVLETLGKQYPLYLLSNTNAIHLDAFEEIFSRQTSRKSLDELFITAYYSHKLGLRKPNEDIFEFVLKDARLAAGETLFIDDSYNNINTAKNMGFLTHLLLPGETIEDLGY
jgi:glucose-1-phosphatase